VMSVSEEVPPAGDSPTRTQVETWWQGVAEGRVARDAAHTWAARWVESEGLNEIADLMVRNALQHLHGYDLTRDAKPIGVVKHSSSGRYIRSLEEITHELYQWRSNCDAYDADPDAYVRASRERAIKALGQLRETPPK
jgi:hypothetical protein